MYEKLRSANYISTLDLKNGYWNAGLTEESKHLTAFSTEFGTYEYNVVPQGLVCSAAHFQKWVETKLRHHGILFEHVSINPSFQAGLDTSALFDENSHYIGTQPIGIAKMQGESGFVAVYIDDLIVFSDSEEEHARHLLKVMEVCWGREHTTAKNVRGLRQGAGKLQAVGRADEALVQPLRQDPRGDRERAAANEES